MNDDSVRVGFVGAGRNTVYRHIPGFRALDGVELVSVANRSRESSQRISKEYQVPKVYDTWADLIAAPDTNAICIGTWPYMHRTLVLTALEHDKHVLTEARLAMNARDAHQILDAARGKPNLIAQVVPALFVAKAETAIKDLIEDGYLGDILAVDLTAIDLVPHEGFLDREAPLHWRHNRDFSGYNAMMLGAWYEILMRLIGPATRVTALTRTNVTSRRDGAGNIRPISVPDHVEILCEMALGPVAHLRFSEITGLVPRDQLWLFGTEGTLRLEAHTMTEETRLLGGRKGDGKLHEIDIPPEKQGVWRVEEEFVNAIRGLEPVTLTTFEDGVKYMEFTEAVTRSAQSGEAVNLPL